MKFARILLATILAVSATAAIAQRMLPNSYIVRPAPTHESLMRQVRNEPVVMDRYKRHFAMTRQEVLDYLGGLRLGRLDRTGVYQIFGVPRDGKLRSTAQMLRRGTLVWEDSMGQPILLEVCGNPFTLGPTRAVLADTIAPTTVTTPRDLVAMQTITTEPIPSNPIETPIQPLTPTFAQQMPVVEPVVAERGMNLGWALLVPAAVALTSQDTIPIPEPATMTALALGAGWMAARRRRAKSS